MKALLAICLLVSTPLAWADAKPTPVQTAPASVKGQVLETMNAGGYTYLRLKTRDGETWAAVNRSSVKNGAEVTIENVMVMQDFESKTLKKTFPKILFGSLGGPASSTPGASADMAAAHANLTKAKDVGDVHVPKASGANARTVAEIVKKGNELKDKPVLVRGKVVKYNPGIMGKNWIHLRDGSGSAADESNDVLVTSMNQAKLGDVVTVKGVVRTNKDFGAGYAYKVLVEDATLQP